MLPVLFMHRLIKYVIVMSKLRLHVMCISVDFVLAYIEFNGEQEKYFLHTG